MQEGSTEKAGSGTAWGKVLIGVIVGLVLVVWAAMYVLDEFKPHYVTVTGTLVEVDPDARTATLKFVHPKSGKPMTVKGQVPPDCQILIDGKPQPFDALKSGSEATVEATIRGGAGVTATKIVVGATPSAAQTGPVPAGG